MTASLSLCALSAQCQTLKIMPLGDSITLGNHGTVGDGGYRYELEQDLIGEHYDFQFVGSQTDSISANLRPQDKGSEGYSGDTIRDFAGQKGIDDVVPKELTAYKPDVILLLIGTNNFLYNDTAVHASADYKTLLTDIYNTEPTVRVIVGTIPSSPRFNQVQISAFNADLSTLVTQFSNMGDKISLANTNAAVTDYVDGIHPTPACYTRIGDVWNASIENVIPAPTPAPPALLTSAIGMLSGLGLLRRKRQKR